MTFENLNVNNLLYNINQVNSNDNVVSYPESLSLLSKSSEVSSSSIASGEVIGDLLVSNGFIRSFNYVAGTSGWTINADGSAEFESGYFRGSIVITGGTGISNLTDAGNLATLDSIGASNCDTTIISGGKIITGLLTADNIQVGTLQGITLIGNTIKTNNSSTPYAKMDSDGITIHGESLAFKDIEGQSASYIGSSNDGLVIAPFGDLIINGNCSIRSYGETYLNATFDDLTILGNLTSGIIPSINNYYLLGTGTKRWASVYSQKHYFGDSNYLSYNDANSISSNCNLVPSSNLIANLGSSALRWYSAYLAEINLNKIHINSSTLLPSSGGDIVNYSYSGVDQFRGQPGAGTWKGSFDMTAY